MEERTFLDHNLWYKHLLNKSWYTICPDNDKYYRTVFVKYNIFQNAPQAMLSNPLPMPPTEGLEHIHPGMLSRLMRTPQFSQPPF